MSKSKNRTGSVIVLLSILMISLLSCGSPSENDTAKSSLGNSATPENATAPSRIHTVKILQMQFVPSEITIHPGDTVLFINKDMLLHDITELAGKKWSSGPLQAGSSWKMSFDTSVKYYCSIHEVMKGKIIVQ